MKRQRKSSNKMITGLGVFAASIDLLNCFLSDQDEYDKWPYDKIPLHVKERIWCP
jgi:hypothetical protein